MKTYDFDIITKGEGEKHVFCLAGMFAGMVTWEKFIEQIPGYKFHIIKQAICEFSSDPLEASERITEAIIKLDLPEVILTGNSFGGTMALIIARNNPELVKYIVVSGVPYATNDSGLKLPIKVDKEWVYELASNIFHKKEVFKREQAEDALKLFTEKRTFLRIIRLLKSSYNLDIEKCFNEINVPILGIWGEKDKITPVSEWVPISNNFPHLSFKTIKNSGHSPMYEDPEEFAQYFLEFDSKVNKKL